MRRINHSSRFIEMFGDPFKNEKGWGYYSLSKVTTIVLGTTPSSSNPDYWDGDIKWITPAELNDDSFYVYDSERHITEAGVRSTALKSFPAGTVIFSTRAPIGKTAIAGCEMYCNQGFKNFICSDKLNPVYLFYTLKSHKEELQKMGTGSTFLELSKKTIEGLSISIPPRELQDEFEVIYKQADKSKFSDFKSRFIEMFGNPLSPDQKYPLKRLGDCVEINPRRGALSLNDSDLVSFVPMPSVSEEGHLQDLSDVEFGKVKKGFTYFKNGDVLFAKITPCMENGKGAIAEGLTNDTGMGSTEFHILRPIEGRSSAFWALALTRLPVFREKAAKNMTGTGGQKRVPSSFLADFPIGLPPIYEQNRFAEIYKQADKSKYLN